MPILSRDPLFWPDGEPKTRREPPATSDILLSRAAYYGLYLRQQGYSAERAAQQVVERYPRTRSHLEKLLGKVQNKESGT